MKKILNLLLCSVFMLLIFTGNVSAETYTEEEVIEKVKDSEIVANEMLNKLVNWSNEYAKDLEPLITRNFVLKLNSVNAEQNIDLIIAELNKVGNSGAANALLNIKSDLVMDYDYLDKALKMIEDYLLEEENMNNGVIGSADLYIQIRNSLKNLKTSFKKLGRIYIDLDYSKLKTELESYKTLEDIVNVYDEHLEQLANMSGLATKIVSLQNFEKIAENYLVGYEDLLEEYLGDYYNKAYEIYDELYLKVENELNNTFNSKITTIVNNTNLNNYESVLDRNTKLYELINYLTKNKNELKSNFAETNNLMGIKFVKEELAKLENKVTAKIDESINYAKSLVIDITGLTVKNEADKDYIAIDYNAGLIVTYLTSLNSDEFLNKLYAGTNKIEKSNLYGENIGTLSKIKVYFGTSVMEEYTIVVKGDINPNGKFDITDVVNLCNEMFDKVELSGIYFMASDMNDDGKIDITDVVKLCNLLFN